MNPWIQDFAQFWDRNGEATRHDTTRRLDRLLEDVITSRILGRLATAVMAFRLVQFPFPSLFSMFT
jgi:hypothetical protein